MAENNNFLPSSNGSNVKITKDLRVNNELYDKMKEYIRDIRKFNDEYFRVVGKELYDKTIASINALYEESIKYTTKETNFTKQLPILRNFKSKFDKILDDFKIEFDEINGTNKYNEILAIIGQNNTGANKELNAKVKKIEGNNNYTNLLATIKKELPNLKKYTEKYNYDFYKTKFTEKFLQKYQSFQDDLFDEFIAQFNINKQAFNKLLDTPVNNGNKIISSFTTARDQTDLLLKQLNNIYIGNNKRNLNSYKVQTESIKKEIKTKYNNALKATIKKHSNRITELKLVKDTLNKEIGIQTGGQLYNMIKEKEENLAQLQSNLLTITSEISSINGAIKNIIVKIKNLEALRNTRRQNQSIKQNFKSQLNSQKTLLTAEKDKLLKELSEKINERKKVETEIYEHQYIVDQLNPLLNRSGNELENLHNNSLIASVIVESANEAVNQSQPNFNIKNLLENKDFSNTFSKLKYLKIPFTENIKSSEEFKKLQLKYRHGNGKYNKVAKVLSTLNKNTYNKIIGKVPTKINKILSHFNSPLTIKLKELKSTNSNSNKWKSEIGNITTNGKNVLKKSVDFVLELLSSEDGFQKLKNSISENTTKLNATSQSSKQSLTAFSIPLSISTPTNLKILKELITYEKFKELVKEKNIKNFNNKIKELNKNLNIITSSKKYTNRTGQTYRFYSTNGVPSFEQVNSS